MRHLRLALPAVAILLASAAQADFAGQTILGPIVGSMQVSGDTTFSTDDNDGFTSGTHIFDIWDGGDDVWEFQWHGGRIHAQLEYDNSGSVDVDLFLYRPTNLDDSGDYSIMNTGLDQIVLNGMPAGTYYFVVDSTAGAEGAYTLSVLLPSPGPAALGGLACVFAGVRRRR